MLRASSDNALLIEAEKIRTIYQSMPGAIIGNATAATLMSVVLYEVVNPLLIWAWLGSVGVLMIQRMLLWRRFFQAQPKPDDIRSWGKHAIVLYGLSGTLWGVANILLYAPDNVAHQLFLLISTIGVGLGAAYAQVSYLPAFYAFLYPALGLAALSFFRESDTIHVMLGIMTLVYLAFISRFVHNLHRSFVDSVKLRFENLALIEDLRREKLAAEEANMAKSRFLAAASHDLRQPLHAMSLFVQTLEESELPRSERATLGNVRRATDAMEELFSTLLDVSKIDAGIVLANISVVPLSPIIKRVFDEFLPVAKEKGLRLRMRNQTLYAKTDPVLLERILRNFVSNAVHHTSRGAVLLACRPRATNVSVEVWDTGPGIPEDKRKDIFGEFYQLRNPERDRAKGLGLGLAIVDRLVKLLNHPITLRSQVGRGSVFSVLLPCGRAEEYVPAEIPPLTFSRVDLQGKWVVVIDNEIAVQQGMESLLQKWLCDVTVAGSWTELQEQLVHSTRVPDLIISDYRLRNYENGIQAIMEIRSEYNSDIPALLVTGDTGPERLREAQASGVALLHKPLRPARLLTLMTSLLAEHAQK